MKIDNKDTLFVKLESILNLLTLLEESFAMNQDIQAESTMKILKVLINDVEQIAVELI